MSSDLKLDWCSYQAAKYAVEHWHYSRGLPAGRKVYIGVWENKVFIGVLVFGMGSGAATNGNRYGLARSHEMAELARVALTVHSTQTSRIVAIGLRLIKQQSPKLRLIISFADPRQGHIGILYQAGGWIYNGESQLDYEYYVKGRWLHHRTATSKGSVVGLPSRPLPRKLRYLYPLDTQMVQCLDKFNKPYPKRPKDSSEPSAFQAEEGGAAPTRTLQTKIGD